MLLLVVSIFQMWIGVSCVCQISSSSFESNFLSIIRRLNARTPLTLPAIVVQFDPPDDPRDYIHRVGRTARGSNGKGRSLMFLQPSEVGFLAHLKTARVPVVEFDFPAKKIVK